MVLVILKKLLTNNDSTKPLLPIHSNDSGYSTIDESSVKSSLSYDGVSNPRGLSDAIIGLSDGLTVPFALTAGLSSLGNSKLVITGGMAELVSGAISMGLGGYLAARSENEYYRNQYSKEKANFHVSLASTQASICETLKEFKFSDTTLSSIANDIEKDRDVYASFMLKFVRGIEKPENGREFNSAMTIGLAYFIGGFIPLIPYFFTDVVESGLIFSIIIMVVTLFIFGYAKTVLSLGTETSRHTCIMNGFSMLLTGGLAAGSAWVLVRALE
ncbi:Ccc1 protein [Starmerella bacillaris]|uniref:Ccc1 protein n=1 Tax=Starmerella bacillaris TaxID=1247836 RepID=A0AAV5RM78_STABA|nr:Ccc1 protein [Starmerella bacillaris]